MIAQNKDLEDILAKTRSDYNAKVRQCRCPPYSNLLSSCAKTSCLFFVQVSALQADIKSLKNSITESTRNEQKALADCRTLQEAVKEMSSLESVLKKKDSNIKALEMEVCL